MKKIMFVCYGNICRSPMAEFLMKDLVSEKHTADEFIIASAATSYEEIGNPVHRGTVKILERMGIDCSAKRSVRLKCEDYSQYDFFIGMDERNVRDMFGIFGGDKENKVKKMLDFTDFPRDVADPYWTRNFEQTFTDIVAGINGLYSFLTAKNNSETIIKNL